MANQSADTVGLVYAPEASYGVAPSSGGKLLRFTGESLTGTADTTESAEIVSTRQSAGSVRTGVSGGGSFDFEMSWSTFDDMLEGALGGTFDSSGVLQVGTALPSFTFEKQFTDLASDRFQRFTGQLVNALSINVAIGSIIGGTVDLLGNFPTIETAAFDGTPDPINSEEVMDVVNFVQAIDENGSPLSGVREFSLAIANNVRLQPQLGSAAAAGAAPGRFVLTGSLVTYFASDALLAKFLDNTETSLELSIGGASSKRYDFLMQRVNFTAGSVNAGSGNSDVLVELEFSAKIDSTASTLQITRTP